VCPRQRGGNTTTQFARSVSGQATVTQRSLRAHASEVAARHTSAVDPTTQFARSGQSILLFFKKNENFFVACFESKQATAKQAQEVPWLLLSPKQEQEQAVFF